MENDRLVNIPEDLKEFLELKAAKSETDTEENEQYEEELDRLIVDISKITGSGYDPAAIRKVKDQDAECSVPKPLYWNTEQMAMWIEKIGFPDYRECIEKNLITGRHLILLDASTLPKLGIYDFEDIKKIAAAARQLINLKAPIKNMKVAMSDPMIAYLDAKRKRGSYMDHITYRAFLQKNRRWFRHHPMP